MMAWFNFHHEDGFRELYSSLAYDQTYGFEPIVDMMQLTKRVSSTLRKSIYKQQMSH